MRRVSVHVWRKEKHCFPCSYPRLIERRAKEICIYFSPIRVTHTPRVTRYCLRAYNMDCCQAKMRSLELRGGVSDVVASLFFLLQLLQSGSLSLSRATLHPPRGRGRAAPWLPPSFTRSGSRPRSLPASSSRTCPAGLTWARSLRFAH